jgi:hypothetical protein
MTDPGPFMSHEQLRAELPELAADVLDGRARAVLLDHVDTCPSCSAELEELTLAADSLVHLAVASDPPLGFETRVFDQMRRRPSRASWRSRLGHRSLMAVAAAAAAVVVAFALGWAFHPGGATRHSVAVSNPGNHPADAALVSGGRDVGVVSVYSATRSSDDGRAWLSMTVEASPWSGPVFCQVTSTDGTSRTVGSFSLTSGYGAWMTPLPLPADSVRTATLVGQHGQVLATARFGHPPTSA